MPKTGHVPPTHAELLPIATEAVDRAAHMVRERPAGQVTMKSDRDPATEVDYAVEREIRDFLAARAPDVDFLGEEEGQFGSSASGFTWALDPVDGTVNFIHDIPLCGVSLGLVHDAHPVLGVIDLPFLNLRYSAMLGGGAYRGTERIHVSDARRLSEAVIAIGDYATGEGADLKNAERIRITQRLASSVERVRMFGSAAVDLAWVAEGRIAGSVMLANKPWDVTAGVLLAREAGAEVIDRHGRRHRLGSESTVAVTPALRDDLVTLLDDLSPVA